MHAAILDALLNDESAREAILAAAEKYKLIIRDEAKRLADMNYNRKFGADAKAMIRRDYGRVHMDQLIVNLSKIHPGRITHNKVRLVGQREGVDGPRIYKRGPHIYPVSNSLNEAAA